jgi:signal transduction histidine kinase/ActR/RegA family two-component response regulator
LRAKGLIVLALPLSMLLVAGAVSIFAGAQADAAQESVAHTRAVEAGLTDLRTLVVDGETGIRAYLATGDRAFLEPTDRARDRLPMALDLLENLAAAGAEQMIRLARIREELGRGLHSEAPEGVGPASTREEVRVWLSEQKGSTDAIRDNLAAMIDNENRRLAAQLAARDAWRARMRVGTGAALLVGVAGGLFGMAAFTFGIARRLERLRADSERLRLGESVPVDEGRDEIGELSRHLDEIATRWLLWQQEAVSARRSAEQASAAKNEFLSRMSHELRTPLNAVLGFAQLLEMDLPPEQQEPVAQIRRAGRHLLDLINEVLDIAKIEGGHLTLSTETVRVTDLIEEALELMAPIAAARDVTVRAVPAHVCSCHVRADRQRAKQVLLNLMSNAVKYNRPGGTVSLRCRVRDGQTAALEVMDTGIGIPAEDLGRMFMPFERLAAAQSDIEGTGVGLALSQRLAIAMGGQIEVISAVGEGSTFTLTLPIGADPLEGHIPPQPKPTRVWSASPAEAAPPVHVHTVLSIEDNLANTRLLQQIVARRPHWRIVTAPQGRLGLDLAAADPPQLVLLDLHLPDMTGAQVLRHLKATRATAGVPVVIVSADATPGQVRRLRSIGASGYLTKPVHVPDILALLDAIAAPATEEAP